MENSDQRCNNCELSDWKEVFDTRYPDSRRERDQTVKTVYVCNSCGAEGKHFEHKNSGTEQMSGAFR